MNGTKLAKVRDRATGAWRYVASNQVSPEIFNQLVAEGEQRKKETTQMANANQTAALETARAEGFKAGAAEFRARFGAIMSSPEAKGRSEQALTLALETDMQAEKVTALLAKSPKEASAEGGASTINERAELWATAQREAGIRDAKAREAALAERANGDAKAKADPWA